MILAVIWTILGAAGFLGCLRNIHVRTLRIAALRAEGLDGSAMLMSHLLRNSEYIRLGQTIIGVLIGVVSMILYRSDYYRQVTAAVEASGLDTPTVVRVFNDTLQFGLLTWMCLLTINIYYFGAIGERATRATRHE